MTNVIENERWRVADWAADFLSVDREVCRRAFYEEPENRVQEVIWRVLSERDLSGYDPERMVERWAREQGAGVYSRDRRRGDLEPAVGAVDRDISGPDAAAFLARSYVSHMKTLRPGRIRYSVMLREDGAIFDDGVVACIGEAHYLASPTSGNAELVARAADLARLAQRPPMSPDGVRAMLAVKDRRPARAA